MYDDIGRQVALLGAGMYWGVIACGRELSNIKGKSGRSVTIEILFWRAAKDVAFWMDSNATWAILLLNFLYLSSWV